jgi:hypothetical protein
LGVPGDGAPVGSGASVAVGAAAADGSAAVDGTEPPVDSSIVAKEVMRRWRFSIRITPGKETTSN